MSDVEPIIEALNVEKVYKRDNKVFRALSGINLKIYPGEFVVILGPSGAGKTTLLNLLSGMDKPSNGDVLIFKKNISSLSEEELSKIRLEHIGFIFQFFNLIDDLTVLENVMLPLIPSERSTKDVKSLAEEKLEEVNMLGKKEKFPRELSGGEQQRVAIARALIAEPDIIMADEPTAQLDENNAKKIAEILKRLNREDGKTIVLATASENVAKMFSDIATKIIRLDRGKIVEIVEGRKKKK